MPEGSTHLYSRHVDSKFECHGVLKQKLILAPASRHSKTHQALSKDIARRGAHTKGKRMQLYTTTEDPEKKKLDALNGELDRAISDRNYLAMAELMDKGASCDMESKLEHLTPLTAACQEDPDGLMYEPVTNADGDTIILVFGPDGTAYVTGFPDPPSRIGFPDAAHGFFNGNTLPLGPGTGCALQTIRIE